LKLAACQRFDPAEVPTDWAIEEIKKRIRLEYGSSLTEDNRVNGNFPVFGSNGCVGTHNSYCVDGPGILVGRKGSVGEVHFSETAFWPIDTVYYVRRLTQDDWGYLYYLLCFLNLGLLNAATGVPGLTRRDAHDILGVFPKVDEQRHIAAILKLADDAISKAQSELNTALDLKRSLLAELLQRGLPGKHTKFIESKKFTYPASWTLTKLSKCGIWSAGGTPDRETASYYEGSIPWVKSGEVNYCTIAETEEHLSEDGAKQTTCRILPIGTLLVAMYGAGVTRGRVALLGVEASTNQAVASFNGHEGIANEFIYYWFEFNYQRIRAWAAGSNQDNLSGYLLKSLPIAIPSHGEQLKIIELLKASDNAIRAVEQKIESLIKMKKSLTQNLLTGKIRIPSTIDIPS
jgi:type I restriction enzyme, S subunit